LVAAPVARLIETSRPAVTIRALAPSGATAKVSAAFGSTADVTAVANFGVTLPVLASTSTTRPAEVRPSSSRDGARSIPTIRSPAARPVSFTGAISAGRLSLWNFATWPSAVTAVKPSAA
jgi:hypothetical protein